MEECKARDATYAAPSRCGCVCATKETEEIKEQEIFMGDFPPDDQGRHLCHQRRRARHRLPDRPLPRRLLPTEDKAGNVTYATTVIPYRGAWLEYETDLNDVFYVRIDKNRKLPITCLIRAVGPGPTPRSSRCSARTPHPGHPGEGHLQDLEEALLEIYRKLRPGEPPRWTPPRPLNALFFDPRPVRPLRRGPL